MIPLTNKSSFLITDLLIVEKNSLISEPAKIYTKTTDDKEFFK